MCVSLNPSIYPIIGTLAGALFGGWLARNTAFKVVERQEITRDYATLKNSFLPSRHILQKDKRTREDIIKLAALFESQEFAMLSFVGHLSGENRKTFEEKWSKYKEWHHKYEELEAQTPNLELGKLAMTKQIDNLSKMIEEILEAGKKF